MKQMYIWKQEKKPFQIRQAETWMLTCHYLHSAEGFVMDKDVFRKHLEKGKIEVFN